MKNNGGGETESLQEEKGIKNGALVESQCSFLFSELKDNSANEAEKAGDGSGLQGPSTFQVQHQQQQQPQGTIVRWERFLHVESIRVLLVENDDSTRHVVTALLRNCNYEVQEAANGLQAWKILEDTNNHIDIVLTEVVMPYLPGIPLLNKIMGHKSRTNIPVIMMSSDDSMGLVFNCLSKGAVDFLVKPIRKNELKNLWQHVWRRCHSSTGSGSESGTQTQKFTKSKGSEKSDNSKSDDGGNDVKNGLNVDNGSDDASVAQSSWTQHAVEIDSLLSPINQVAECPDSTCAQVIRRNAENSDCNRVHISVARGVTGQKKDLEIKSEIPSEIPLSVIGSKPKSLSEFCCRKIIEQIGVGQHNPIADSLVNQDKGGSYETSNPRCDGRGSDSTREVANTEDKNNNATIDSNKPNTELSLKRHRGVQDMGRSVQDRCVLRWSEQSAFSRYNTCSKFSKAPNGITGFCSLSDSNVKAAKREPVHVQTHSTDHFVYRSSNGVGNHLNMGSTTNKLPTNQSILNDKFGATSKVNGLNYSAFRPVKEYLMDSQEQPPLPSRSVQTTNSVSAKGSQSKPQIQQSHHRNYYHYQQLHDVEQQRPSDHDALFLKKLVKDAPHIGSTNDLGGPFDGTGTGCTVSTSISGSTHGSNGRHGNSIAVNAAGTTAESDVGQAGRSGSQGGSGSAYRVDEDKIAHRIAALSKFRQKKEDRSFMKKVRYQSRKKLAEQRPRVRGQFVKHSATDSSNRNSDE